MNLNATLLVQILFFVTFIGITMKYIWPPVTNALEQRRKTIADGLAEAEQGRRALHDAELRSQALIEEAKAESARILEQANRRSLGLIDEAKERARGEAERVILAAQAEIEQRYASAKSELMRQVSSLVVAGAEKILQQEVDQAKNDRLIRELVSDNPN